MKTVIRCAESLALTIFIALVFFTCSSEAQSLAESARSGMLPGQSVGSLITEKDGGGKVNLGKPGKPYVLGFFVPGRTDIQVQFRELNDILAKKEFKTFAFYAVTRGKDSEEKKNAREFLKSAGIKAVLLFDGNAEIAKRFGTLLFPSFYIVDKEGNVRSLAIQSVTQMIRRRTFEDFLKLALKGDPIPYVDMVPYEDLGKNTRALIGKPAPDFTLQDLKDKQYTLSKLDNKNVIVVYFSPTCPHCMIELPRIQDFYINYKTRYDVEVLAITRAGGKEGEKKVKEVIDKNMLTFPVLLDEKGSVAAQYGISYVPIAFFIDKKGVLVDVVTGENEFFALIYHSIFRDPLRMAK